MEKGASLEKLGEADAVLIEQLEIAVAGYPSSLVGIGTEMSAIAS